MPQPRKARAGSPNVSIAYIRVSTDEQKLGPEAQRSTIEAWAFKEDINIANWYTDLGVSGGTDLDQRPGLLSALGALRVHKAGLLVIAKRDRLARDPAVAALIERAVTQQGARIVSADGLANSGSAADNFLKTILDGAAAYERALIRARTKEAMKAKRAQGFRAGTVPFGYQADETGKLSPHEGEQAIIALTKQLRGEGYSLREIVEALAERGVVSRAGEPLQLTQVVRLVRIR